jgi:4-amino-4-deoxy-L-arabinose transferase-like glycosyltransferase
VNKTNSFQNKLLPYKRLVVILLVLLTVILVAAVVIWLNLSWRPDMSQLPPDSGFYAYVGKAILHEQLPYRDLWDNKPPIGYYLNALALAVFGQTPWGVWWFSVVWILGCILLFFAVIKKLFGGITAWISSAIFLVALMNPQIFQGGNLTEVYSLAPQIGIIGITCLYFTIHRKTQIAILAGVLTACTLMIKQPTIMLGCSSIVIMIVSSISQKKIKETIRAIMGFVVGFIGLVGLIALYWFLRGALGNFIDGALLQGFAYIGGAGSSLREYFFYTLVYVLPSLPIGQLFLIGMFAGAIFLVDKLYQFWLKPVFKERLSWIEWCLVISLALFPLIAKRMWPDAYFVKFWVFSILSLGLFFLVKLYRLPTKLSNQQVFTPVEWTWLIGLIALPLEVLMASLGGRYFGHYFITMIPAVILTIALPIWKLASVSREAIKSKVVLITSAAYTLLAISSLVWATSSFLRDLPSSEYTQDLAGIFQGKVMLNKLEEYIVQTTQPDDSVLVWHIHLGINFITDRNAPSRFLFPLNLFIPPNENNTKLKEYTDELEAKPPELILVQKVSSISLPFVDQPIDQLCTTYCTPEFVKALEIPQIHQEWLRFQQFFLDNYAFDNKIYDWIVYRKLR